MNDQTHPIPTIDASRFSETTWRELPVRPDPDQPGKSVREVILTDNAFDDLAFRVRAILSNEIFISASAVFDPPTAALRPADFDALSSICERVARTFNSALVDPWYRMPVAEFTPRSWWDAPLRFESDAPEFWVRSLSLTVESDLEPSVEIDVTSSASNSVPTVFIQHADDAMFPAEARALVPALVHVNKVIDDIIRHP